LDGEVESIDTQAGDDMGCLFCFIWTCDVECNRFGPSKKQKGNDGANAADENEGCALSPSTLTDVTESSDKWWCYKTSQRPREYEDGNLPIRNSKRR
jgi:hypothetical protein